MIAAIVTTAGGVLVAIFLTSDGPSGPLVVPMLLIVCGVGMLCLILMTRPVKRLLTNLRASELAIVHEIHNAQGPVGPDGQQGQLLSVEIYNRRETGPPVREVVPTIEAVRVGYPGTWDAARVQTLTRFDCKHVVRGHGWWLRDPFGHWQPPPDPATARRRDLPATGERELLGIVMTRTEGDRRRIRVLDRPSYGMPVGQELGPGYWRLTLTLRAESVRPAQFDFTLDVLDSKPVVVLLRLVKRYRRWFIGPVKDRTLAVNAARFDPGTWRSRLRRWVRW